LTAIGLNTDIATAFEEACLTELDAVKPGNVHRFSDGHRMRVADFEASARAASPAIALGGLQVGERIRRAVEATRATVGQNTNLGILLLAGPLAQAALAKDGPDLPSCLAGVLAGLTIEDAREVYAAIRHAGPGGLGTAPEHDVGADPSVTLLEAMRAAESRDRIAWNYAHDFADIFASGLPALRTGLERFKSKPWAASLVYLTVLAARPDTLIARKFGEKTAVQVMEEAAPFAASIREVKSPASLVPDLLDFDEKLKMRGLNPGTTADLTVATLFAHALESIFRV
jgi:triphosphoribosyl-dephospho-CoA synthase